MNYYRPTHEKDEACEEYSKWNFRFIMACQGFFFGCIVMLFMGQYRSSLVCLIASLFWFWAGGVITYRHLKWHRENDGGRRDDLR